MQTILQDSDFIIKYRDYDHEYHIFYKQLFLSSHKFLSTASEQLNIYKQLKTAIENGKS